MGYRMQEIQKATCSSCEKTFVAKTLCPLCSSHQEHQHCGLDVFRFKDFLYPTNARTAVIAILLVV